jgi:HTH-type transcriptional regulator/antitoxin HipB
MDLFEIGQVIRAKRKNVAKLSQEKAGAALGMSRSTISGIETGTIDEIGLRKFMALCTSLGLEVVVQEKRQRPTLQQLRKENQNA